MKNLLQKLPLTSAELQGVLFASVIFLIGFIFRTTAGEENFVHTREYEEQNRQFSELREKIPGKETEKIDNSSIDNHQDFFDFTDSNSERKKNLDSEAENPFPLDLNRASKEDLMLVPGIGAKKAEAIITVRNQISRFQSVDQLLQVKGIGSKTLEKIRKYFLIQ